MTCSSAGSPLCCRAGSLQNIQNVGAQCSFYYFKTWKANELFLPSQKLLLELSYFFFLPSFIEGATSSDGVLLPARS